MKLASGALVLLFALNAYPDEAVTPTHRQALQRFKYEFHRPGARDDDRIRAINRVAEYRHEDVVRALSSHVSKGSLQVRIVATRKLREFKGVKGAPEALYKALRSNSSPRQRSVRIEAIRGLGELKASAVIRDINRLIADRHDWIAKAAIDAAGKIRHKSSIDPLLKLLRKIEGPSGNGMIDLNPVFTELPDLTPAGIIRRDIYTAKRPSARDFLRAPINGALQSITREPHRQGYDWRKWWRENKSKFRVPD